MAFADGLDSDIPFGMLYEVSETGDALLVYLYLAGTGDNAYLGPVLAEAKHLSGGYFTCLIWVGSYISYALCVSDVGVDGDHRDALVRYLIYRVSHHPVVDRRDNEALYAFIYELIDVLYLLDRIHRRVAD